LPPHYVVRFEPAGELLIDLYLNIRVRNPEAILKGRGKSVLALRRPGDPLVLRNANAVSVVQSGHTCKS
jgi:hypothetical protein